MVAHTQPPESILRSVLADSRLGPAIKNTADRDRAHHSALGFVHRVTGPLTVNGGTPPRYTVKPPTPNDVTVCALEDAVGVLHPARELATLRSLGELRRKHDTNVLERVVVDRLALFRLALGSYAKVGTETEVLETLAAMHSRYAILSNWVEEATVSYSAKYSRGQLLEPVHHDMASLERLVTDSLRRRQPAAVIETLRFVGRSALAAARPIRELTTRAIASGEITAARPNFVYASARRFPNADAPKVPTSDERSCLDRVDALLEVFRYSRARRAQQYLSLAETILGPTLRDATYVRARLVELTSSDQSVRSAFLVAVGLLGEPNEVAAAAEDRRQIPNATAFVLSSALAILDPDRLADRLDAAVSSFRGRARTVLCNALRRLDRGAFLTILEPG
jgi:hypothetical protein